MLATVVQADDEGYLLVGTDLAEIGKIRIGKLVKLAVLAPGEDDPWRVFAVLADAVSSRHADAPDGGDRGQALRLLCEAHLSKHGGKLLPGHSFAVKVLSR